MHFHVSDGLQDYLVLVDSGIVHEDDHIFVRVFLIWSNILQELENKVLKEDSINSTLNELSC